jgi:iron complex outermembrane recepter protein
VHPLQKDGRIEAGYKSIIRNIDNDFVFRNFSYAENQFQIDPLLSNDFRYREQVHSLYGNYTNTLGKFGYQLGGRLEQTLTNSIQKTTGQDFVNNYLNFFPSVFLSYKLPNEQQWQLNYSRRINRPSIWNLNPFVNYSDPLNIRFGNPRLNPELTNAFEVSYLKGWKNFFLTSSAYYRQTNDVIQRIITVNEGQVPVPTYLNPDSLSTFLISFENLNTRTAYGFEFIGRTTITKWWNVTTNFNFFRSAINGTNLETNFNNANVSWSVMLMSNMSIPKIAQVQLNGNYRGPVATAQGIMQAMYGINLGVKRDVLKNNGSVSLNVSDIFDTRQFGMVTSGPNFDQTSLRKRETRIATLTFTYNFGKFSERGERGERRRGGADGGEGRGGDEDFF